ncbi:MAG: hypothetical protein R3B90_20720 [Planctomycetaceae bacterium]
MTDDVLRLGSKPISLEQPATAESNHRALRYSRRPQLSPAGELLGHVWTIRDVTQLHLAESMRDQFVAAATH